MPNDTTPAPIGADAALVQALEKLLANFESQHALLLQLGAPDFVAMRDQARAALSTAAQPPAGIWVPTELAERVQETMGEFLMDHDWRQTDMDTADAFGALLAAAPKAAPAPDLELTDAQIFDIAADPATCPAPPWWHRDEVAAGDVRKAVLAFARAIIRASRGQAPAPAAVAPQNPPMPETWHVDVHVHGEKS